MLMDMNFKHMSMVLVSMGLICLLFITFSQKNEKINVTVPGVREIKIQETSNRYEKFLSDRKKLSILLNQEKKKSGQLECNIKNTGTKGEEQVADSGGYCQEEGSIKKRQGYTDTSLTNQVSILLKGKRVGAFGDGPGMYKQSYDKIGLLDVYDAYDGAPFIETETSGSVKFLDLTIPQYGLPIYDWVICLEVAEHIPVEYEDIFLSNLARHAKTGLILSWAVPGQPGHYHVNNKEFSLVIETLRKVGFDRDEKMSKFLQTQARNGVFKSNLNVYYRNENFPIDMDDA